MAELNIDYEDFTNLIRDNSSALTMALQSIAYRWAKGEEAALQQIDDDPLHLPHWWFVQQVARQAGQMTTHGGQHIPRMLREIADRAEAAQVNFVKENFADKDAALIAGIGEVYQDWLKNGFPVPPVYCRVDEEMTARWRAALSADLADSALPPFPVKQKD
jgi:hypothetical protein